jgi:hypothetical protein
LEETSKFFVETDVHEDKEKFVLKNQNIITPFYVLAIRLNENTNWELN